jgi:hypothetical protein
MPWGQDLEAPPRVRHATKASFGTICLDQSKNSSSSSWFIGSIDKAEGTSSSTESSFRASSSTESPPVTDAMYSSASGSNETNAPLAGSGRKASPRSRRAGRRCNGRVSGRTFIMTTSSHLLGSRDGARSCFSGTALEAHSSLRSVAASRASGKEKLPCFCRRNDDAQPFVKRSNPRRMRDPKRAC